MKAISALPGISLCVNNVILKNKYVKYLLIAAVACVWGTILYRIAGAIGDSSPVVAQQTIPVTDIPFQGTHHYILVAGYPDPFLKDNLPVMDTVATNALPAAAVTPPPPVIDISFVQYLGMISNIDHPKKVALVNVNGKEEMVKEGDVVGEVRVRKILPGELKVVYKGKEFVVKKV